MAATMELQMALYVFQEAVSIIRFKFMAKHGNVNIYENKIWKSNTVSHAAELCVYATFYFLFEDDGPSKLLIRVNKWKKCNFTDLMSSVGVRLVLNKFINMKFKNLI